jgi:hypothetical protein
VPAFPHPTGEHDLAYRIQRLTADRPDQERQTIAMIAIGLLAVSLGVTVGLALPSSELAVTAPAYTLSLLGVAWLSWRGVAPVTPVRGPAPAAP